MIYFAFPVTDDVASFLTRTAGEPVTFGPLPDPLTASSQWPTEFVDTQILVARGHELDPRHIEGMRELKWVHSIATGIDRVPLDALQQRNIVLSNSRGVSAQPMAEQIMGTMIAFNRGFPDNWENRKAHRWVREAQPLDELSGKTLIIIGAGTIGVELARKAKAFDMRVVGVRTRPGSHECFDSMVGLHDLDLVLGEGDIVVVLLPLTSKTRHFINARRLGLMKPTVMFLNYSRGSVVDEAALMQALHDHTIRCAGLDVFEEEPLAPTHPFWSLDNVLLSPHNGGLTPHYGERLAHLFIENLGCYRQGRPLKTGIDFAREY